MDSKFTAKHFRITIVFLAVLQVLCSTYFLNIEGFFAINSILFLLAGVGISLCLLKVEPIKFSRKKLVNKQLFYKLIAVIILLPFSYHFSRQILDKTPLQIEYADMLPIMKVMCNRFLNGDWQKVYQPIPEIWKGIEPIYLPALWMPFSASILFHFDMRWITVCGVWLSVLVCIWPAWQKNYLQIILPAAILTLLIWFHFDNVNNVIRLSEEGVVFIYFTLMVVAIISKNPWFVGVVASLCLLSRYSMIGWIPFAGLYLVLTKQYSFLFKTLIAGIAVILLLLVIPFGIQPLLFHLKFPEQYITAAVRVWDEHPEYYYRSLGMAKFFGPAHVQLLHYVLISGTFLLPLILLAFKKKKLIAQPNFLLAGFQLTVTFFYNFLDVSYLYLFYTPVFVSIAIASWVASQTPE